MTIIIITLSPGEVNLRNARTQVSFLGLLKFLFPRKKTLTKKDATRILRYELKCIH
jgi:predicted ATP-dependent Lon-type protease